jgi:alpha-beta hydrolase superfamily lysophospholipase
MNKQIAIGVALLVILGGAWLGARTYVSHRAEQVLIAPAPMGSETPADVGLPYSAFTIPSGNRALHAWLVRAPDSVKPRAAVLVFHGNRTAISDLVGLQSVLFSHGITSMVFDYSGFGSSNGTPSVRRLREDAVSAWAVFGDSVGREPKKFVLGTSLGAAVLMDAINEIQLGVDGVMLVGTFASSRRTAVRQARVPGILAFILRNHYDNVRAATRLRRRLLVVHSSSDELFPLADAESIAAAAEGPTQLVRLPGVAHDSYLSEEAHWTPVLEFIETTPRAEESAESR